MASRMVTARHFVKAYGRRCIARASSVSRQMRYVASRATQVDVKSVAVASEVWQPDPSQAAAITTAATSDNANVRPAAMHTPPPGPAPAISSTDGNDQQPLKVADLDALRFQLHHSVFFWRDFDPVASTMRTDLDVSFASSVQQLTQQAAQGLLLQEPQAAAYWAYHSARMTFFVGQAAAGLLAYYVSESLPASITSLLGLPAAGSPTEGRSGGGHSSSSSGIAQHKLISLERIMSKWNEDLGRPLGPLGEAVASFQQDYDNIRAGYYGLPWDMTPSHRQNNPLFMMRRTAQSMQESASTLQRSVHKRPEPVWLHGSMYPRYYAKTFHYQTDGWMSDRSARIYEHVTEMLFFGRQDAMQRTSLLPLAHFLREAQQAGRRLQGMRLLEVAAGTGRFHTFIKDAYPELPSVVSDLSPFYLARARENLRYWRATRQPSRRLGGVEGTGVEFLQAAAEDITAPDESFDIVVCVYLFHELPEPIRRRAVSEFFRVLRPGGLMVFTDSVQLGDRPVWDDNLNRFTDFNEPFYRSYTSCDLGALFEAAGFRCDTKYISSATKTLSFRKPGPLDPSRQ